MRKKFQQCGGSVFFTIPFPTHRVCMGAKLLPSCPTLCNPMDCTPPGSSVHGILQARILECVAMPSSRGSSQTRDQNLLRLTSPAMAGRFFSTSAPWEALPRHHHCYKFGFSSGSQGLCQDSTCSVGYPGDLPRNPPFDLKVV